MPRPWLVALSFLLVACASTPVPAPTVEAKASPDVEMESATQQARETLDVFLQTIEAPHPDRTFVAVKARFLPPDEPAQEIWVDEVTYANGVLRGSMGDDIPSLKLSLGERVTVAREDIVDWMIVEDGKLIGGYTIRLAVQRMSPVEKQRFLETLDYSIED
jgi:uncharacterized protein YegJ (DUF2314 family)